jgi:hypothetical protein
MIFLESWRVPQRQHEHFGSRTDGQFVLDIEIPCWHGAAEVSAGHRKSIIRLGLQQQRRCNGAVATVLNC